MRYLAAIVATVVTLCAAVGLFGCPSVTESGSAPQPTASAVTEPAESPGEQEGLMEADRIVITVGGQEFQATLDNTEAARAFAKQLPLHLQLEELNGNEKYAYLDNPLPTDSRNPETIHAGDLMLFGSSCIVLFYQTFPTQYTYTPIAHLDDASGLAECVGTGDVDAQIAVATDFES
jgi:hypothetical protein